MKHTLKKEVQIPGTDIVLEKGDTIEVLEERAPQIRQSEASVQKKIALTELGILLGVVQEDFSNKKFAGQVEGIYKRLESIRIL